MRMSFKMIFVYFARDGVLIWYIGIFLRIGTVFYCFWCAFGFVGYLEFTTWAVRVCMFRKVRLHRLHWYGEMKWSRILLRSNWLVSLGCWPLRWCNIWFSVWWVEWHMLHL